MAKKTIDQKIDDLAIITVNGFRRVEKRLDTIESDVAELKGDVAELKGDVAELKEGHSWMHHEIEVMVLDLKDIKRQLGDIELRLKVLEELYEDEQKDRISLKRELDKIKERVAFIEAQLR